jgi:hypothetical protein
VVETPLSLLLSLFIGFATPPSTPTNWNLHSTPLTIRSRKQGLKYVRSQTISAIDSDIPITPSVLQVQDKVAQASEQHLQRIEFMIYQLQRLPARKEKKLVAK